MITEVQRQLRDGKIGSSDAAAICGFDEYRTPYDVWATMTGRVKPFSGNMATEVGTYLERGVLDWVEATKISPLTRDVWLEHSDGIRSANLDAIGLASSRTIIEVKTTGILGPSKVSAEYGDPEDGIEAVPYKVAIQTHHQAAIAEETYGKIDLIAVAALIGWRGFVFYEFEPNRQLMDVIGEKVVNFYNNNVKTDTPPEGGPSEEIAKVLPRVSGKVVPVDPKIVADWRKANDEAAEAKKRADASKSLLLAALGDAEAAECDGEIVTYKQYKRKAYSVEASEYRQLKYRETGV